MKTKFNGILTLLLAFVVQISFAQEKTISGTVSDNSGSLPGVSVIIKGSTTGTETDFDGKYSIKAKAGDVLVFRYLGYKANEQTVGASNVINVTMAEDANVLEEIVIVGYGTSTKKSFTGTATTVTAENLEAKNFANVSQALTGEVAGVTVINSSGQPGTIGTVRIRGYGSPLGNRAPLYVIDGVPFNGAGELNAINPADIKSTTVLKDATATAIYGSRGANGVILITTKSGSSNEKSYIEVDVKSGVNFQEIDRYNVLSSPEEYVGLVWEGLYNRGVVTNNADPVGFANGRLLGLNGIGDGYNIWDATTATALIDPTTRSVRSGVNRLFTPERFADIAFGTGIRTETNVRMGGGSDKSKYFFSAGYLEDSGYSINSDYKRYTTRLNLTADVKPWLKVSANFGYAYSESTNNGQTNGSENVFEFADKMAPLYPVYARYPNTGDLVPDPIYGGAQFDYGSPTGLTAPVPFTRARPNSDLLNPIGSATLDFVGSNEHALNGNFSADFKLTDWLTFETRYGGQYSFNRGVNAGNHVYGPASNSNGTLTASDAVNWSKTFLQLLRFNKSFGDHSLEVIAAHETFESSLSFSQQYKQEVLLPGVYNLSNYLLSQQPAFGYVNESGIESYFGQATYNYANKYFFSGSLRTDGSSRFINDKWGTFGSVGASWVVSEEDFMKDTFLSYLKVKASYGVTGDQQGPGTSTAFTRYGVSYVGGLAISESVVGNPDLTWETSTMIQGGVEMSFGNYLDVNVDYYRKNTDNLFFNQRVGPSSGISSILVNDGEVLNAGLEFDVTAHIIKKADFSLDFAVNGEMISNEMVTLPLDVTTGLPKLIDENSSTDGAYAFTQGRSIFDFYMREWAGVDPADGAPMWYQYYDDKNNNNILDAGEGNFALLEDGSASSTSTLYEYQLLAQNANIKKTTTKTYANGTQTYIGKSFIPDVRGAFRISGKIKNFDFSTQFTYSLGGYAYDGNYAELMSDRFGAAGNNFHKDILLRWQNPGDLTGVPILSDNAVVNATSQSSRFITSTDYLALNNARIGYTVPSSFIAKSGVDAINLWVSGDNLFLNTARAGFNPNNNSEAGNSGRQFYAPATTITMGVRVKF
ncbi:MAG: SusC/RagA family TonB-linked outer membrane protein [Polaribacter sp.]|uniref:SusC/RagA family TonB-linked outer membrane protein n=1 Tax=Polaribacter sp. TaxID=1920175 RepID=UPI003BAF4CE3